MERDITVRRREAITVVSRRTTVRLPSIGGTLAGAFGEVYGYLQAGHGEPSGPPFVIYHGAPNGDEPFEVEVCAPVVRAVDPPEGWRIQELPAGTFATLVHVGPYDTIGTAYEAMTAWIDSRGMSLAGPPREVYLSEPGTRPEDVRTVIEFPVSDAAVAAAAR